MGAVEHQAIDAFRLVDRLWADYFAPRHVLPVDEYADRNRVLPRETSAEHGQYRTDRTPYARQIMRDLSDDSPYEDIVLMMATQLIKSECGLNWLASIIDQTPAPTMIVQATVDTAKRYSRQRVGPMIAACPTLREKVSEVGGRDSANTMFMKEFPGGFLVITGANSAPGLASMPARYIHFDERDDYPDDVNGQGEPTKIARARQDTFRRRKRLTSSSPKRARGLSRIEADFQAGTRFYYHVPCPHCGHRQRLEWERMLKTDPRTVGYACAGDGCDAVIEEHHKPEMFAAGEWIAENPSAKIRSYHLSSLYSPLGWLSWASLVEEHLEAEAALSRGDETPRKAFDNTRLAITYEEASDKVEAAELSKRAENYLSRTVPSDALILTAGIDTQDNRFEIVVYGWGEGEESWVIDYMQLFCDPAEEASWWKLSDYLATRFPHESGQTLGIDAEAIDTGGHFTHQVYGFARGRKRTFAIKGADRPGQPVKGKATQVDVNWRGKIIKRGVKLWWVGTDSAKDLLHNRLSFIKPGPGYIHFPRGLSDEFYAGLTSEQRVRQRTARGERSTWVKRSGGLRNEPWDCSVYALFAAHALDLHKYTEKMWDRLRERVAPTQMNLLAAQAAQSGDPGNPSVTAAAAESVKTGPSSRVQTSAPRRAAGVLNRGVH